MVLNGDASSPFIAGNREIEISARGTDSQDDYVDHFTTAVSRSNIRTFTAQPFNCDVSPLFIISLSLLLSIKGGETSPFNTIYIQYVPACICCVY